MKNQEARQENEKKEQLNVSRTVRSLMTKVRENFPSSYLSLMAGDFITNSRSFVDSILSSPEKLKQVLENLPNNCEVCGGILDLWKHKEPKSFLLALGHIKLVKISAKFCPECKIAVYPEFYKNGLIFAHNKFLITIEAILDMMDILKNNGSLIQSIEDKLRLLGKLEGIEAGVIESDIANNSVKLEKITLAIASLLGTSHDNL